MGENKRDDGRSSRDISLGSFKLAAIYLSLVNYGLECFSRINSMGRSNTFLIINLNTRFRNLDIYLLKFFRCTEILNLIGDFAFRNEK